MGETDDGSRSEVQGFWNPESRTSSRAFLASPTFRACVARPASLASLAARSNIASSRGVVGIMPQYMVSSPYYPK